MVNTSTKGKHNPKIPEELDKADWQEISLSSCSPDSCGFLCIWFSLCESFPLTFNKPTTLKICQGVVNFGSPSVYL